jgi:sec-independent protein translocase protein TatB
MFGLGAGELIIIAIVALLALGPDKLPDAAKKIGKGIRDLKRQTRDLQSTIEHDTEIGGAVRDFKAALRGEDLPSERPPIPPAAKKTPSRDPAPTPSADEQAIPAGFVDPIATDGPAPTPPPPNTDAQPDEPEPVSETDAPDPAPDETPDSSAHG